MTQESYEIGGMNGKILLVDFFKNETSTIEIPPEVVKKYTGGRGLGAYYLSKMVDSETSPLHPENRLIFMNGPLAGSLIPGNNKVCVTFKSPLTKSYSYSLCGGHWGPELKFCRYDGLIVLGKSKDPVYLWLHDGKAEIRSAEKVWGKTIPETEEIIREEIGDDGRAQIAAIGPSG